MIGYLSGTVRGRCVVVNGVGYVVNSVETLPEGETVDLYVTTVVREDDISLYGFGDEVDQELFSVLRKVPGVGATMALHLLRDVGAAEIVTAIREGAPKALSRAAGVGPKKAAAICATARDLLPPGLADAALKGTEATPSGLADLIDTLEGLGIEREAARKAAAAALGKVGAEDDAMLLSAALAHLRSGT